MFLLPLIVWRPVKELLTAGATASATTAVTAALVAAPPAPSRPPTGMKPSPPALARPRPHRTIRPAARPSYPLRRSRHCARTQPDPRRSATTVTNAARQSVADAYPAADVERAAPTSEPVADAEPDPITKPVRLGRVHRDDGRPPVPVS